MQKLELFELQCHACGSIHSTPRVFLIVEQLLEAGADPREVNKDGDKPADIVSIATPSGQQLRDLLRKAEATAAIDTRDIANGTWHSRCAKPLSKLNLPRLPQMTTTMKTTDRRRTKTRHGDTSWMLEQCISIRRTRKGDISP